MIAVGTKAQIKALVRAFNRAEGLPLRGVAVGMAYELPAEPNFDANGDALPTPGFTTQATEDPVEAGTQACVEIPVALEKYLGRTFTVRGTEITLPTKEQLAADDSALPAALRDAWRARKGAGLAAQGATR